MQRRMADAEEQEHAMSLARFATPARTLVGAQLVARSQWNRATSCAPTPALAFLLLILLLPSAHAADFGRIFYTPEQRAQMDYEYGRNVSAEGDSGVIMVNGIVQRRGGKRTVWINGAAQEAGHSDERNPTSVPVSVPGKKKPVEIKVGQRLLIDAPAAPVASPDVVIKK